jgi:hypothetical protein
MASKPETERRRSKRFPLESVVTVKADGVEHRCATKDISTGGAFFYCDAQIAQDSPIQLVMILPPEVTGGGEQWACCHGRVVRVEESSGGQRGVAVKIERVSLSPLATA